MMYHYSYLGPFYIFGWLIFILIIMLVLRASQRGGFSDKMPKSGFVQDSAMDLLRERYAKGEINKEEFETKRKDLML